MESTLSPTLPRVTVVMVPRERFGRTLEAIDAIQGNTSEPFVLRVVDGHPGRRLRRQLQQRSQGPQPFELVATDKQLTPNQARNLGAADVSTELVCFVDNDVLPESGWLEAMIRCLDETGASAVGPLYLEGAPDGRVVHMAGGWMRWEGERPTRMLLTEHRHQGLPLAQVAEKIVRQPCDFLEFHTLLMSTRDFETIGPLDERLTATREHLDLSLRIEQGGGSLWVEPSSRVLYVDPPPIDLRDVPYFLRRWSDRRTLASLEVFIQRHGIDRRYLERVHIYRGRRKSVLKAGVQQALRPIVGDRVAGSVVRVLASAGRGLRP